MQITNPRFLLARRRAARYGLGLDVPAYVRKHLEPRVQIGILRDPAAPIEIQPAIHTPEPRNADGLVMAIVLMGVALVAFGVI
ncbi:hypothetical protein [Castellaniella sp. UC4442_H9]